MRLIQLTSLGVPAQAGHAGPAVSTSFWAPYQRPCVVKGTRIGRATSSRACMLVALSSTRLDACRSWEAI